MMHTLESLANKPCPICNRNHLGRICPMIKALDFTEMGEVRRIEIMTPVDFPQHRSVADPTGL